MSSMYDERVNDLTLVSMALTVPFCLLGTPYTLSLRPGMYIFRLIITCGELGDPQRH